MVEKIGTYEDKSIKCHHKKYLVDKFIFKFRCLSLYQATFRHEIQNLVRKRNQKWYRQSRTVLIYEERYVQFYGTVPSYLTKTVWIFLDKFIVQRWQSLGYLSSDVETESGFIFDNGDWRKKNKWMFNKIYTL